MNNLSEVSRTLPLMLINPWKRLVETHPGVDVKYDDLGLDWGRTVWEDGKPLHVLLHRDLTQVQRRVTLAHEIEHLDRGAPCETLRASIERRVLDATARYLLPSVEILGTTLAVYDLHRAAAELWVTFPVLVDRLRGLSDTELNELALIARVHDWVA